MKPKSLLIKIAKISGIAIGALLLLMLILPFFFQDRVANEVKKMANESLVTPLNFSKARLTFFSHFPNLTLNIYDFSIMGSAPFQADTLISTKQIAFGIDIMSLFEESVKIQKVYFVKADIKILISEKGVPNYDVFKPSGEAETKDTTAADSTAFPKINIETIRIINSHLVYEDRSLPLKIDAVGLNYTGKGDLAKSIFELASNASIDRLSVIYDNVPYLDTKPVRAKLKTKINTESLTLELEKNEIRIGKLPVFFTGSIEFQKTGTLLTLDLNAALGKEYVKANLQLDDVGSPLIRTKIDSRIDLETWSKAVGVKDVALKGQFEFHLVSDGRLSTGPDTTSLRPGIAIYSIPTFELHSSLEGGSVQYAGYPQALTGIAFNLNISSKDGNYRNINISIEKLQAAFGNNRIDGYLKVNGLDKIPVDGYLRASCNLAELKEVLPLDSMEIAGLLKADLDMHGKFDPASNVFPKMNIIISLKDGRLRTPYYPEAIENINILASADDSSANLEGLSVRIIPFTFEFEGKPFSVQAKLRNFNDVEYEVAAHGTFDVGKIYKVFAYKGLSVDGLINADLSLKGRQSDAEKGRYGLLSNSGTLTLENIGFTWELFPLPFKISRGTFLFDQDKVKFQNVRGTYGNSGFELNGSVGDILGYALSDNTPLKGLLRLNSDYFDADEFMAFAPEPVDSTASADSTRPQGDTVTGVIIVPGNLRVGLQTKIRKVKYQGLDISDLTGTTEIRDGLVLLKHAQFGLAGCKVSMDATYGSITPKKAFFDLAIKADSFDVQRVYKEVELFRNLVSSAADAQGIISLDYKLKGELDENMYPVMPSLTGGGTLSVAKVKVKGLKLFTVMSKGTGKENIKNPDLSKVEFKTTIAKNVITLDQVKMKMAGFRLRLAGTTNFDGKLNFRARLGLPPLGLVGIPMKIMGTSENPKIKYGKGNDENAPETEYSDQVPKEMLDRIKNAKEEDIEEPVK